MAKPRTYRISIMFRPGKNNLEWSGFLDMLRYDRSTVESWGIQDGTVEVVLTKENAPHTIDRWRSFGVLVADLLTK